MWNIDFTRPLSRFGALIYTDCSSLRKRSKPIYPRYLDEHRTISFTEEKIILSDPELGLDFKISCSLPRFTGGQEHWSVEQRDPDGKLRSKYLVQEGKRHGECHFFHEEGEMLGTSFYLMDLLHGPSTFLENRERFSSKTWYIHGKKTGKAHTYYTSGKVASVQRFVDRLSHGLQEYFYEDGATKSLLWYEQGKLDKRCACSFPMGR